MADRLCAEPQPVASEIPSFFVGSRQPATGEPLFLLRTRQFSGRFAAGEVVFQLPGQQLAVRFAGANNDGAPSGIGPLPGHANFLLGDDPQHWQTALPLFSGVAYRDLYPGIDLLYSASHNQLKSEFIVDPAADPALIRLSYPGVSGIRLDPDGSLIVRTKKGLLRESAPAVFQTIAGVHTPIAARYRILADGSVGFEIASYDSRLPLTIDPELQFSTLLGGSSLDFVMDLAVGPNGEVYLAGWTDSANFPVVNPLQSRGGSVEVFVVKFNATATAIDFATFVGGAGDDRGNSIALDAAGNVFVTGYTGSLNFPKLSPLQSSLAGGRDAFLFKLNPTGTAFVFSTYWGGASQDEGRSVAVDSAGNAYLAGGTFSTNFPVFSAYQNLNAGGQDAFLAKVGGAGTLFYSTLFGGQADDQANGVAVDASGYAYITGRTQSVNLPTAGAPQPGSGGGQDAFITKFSASATQLFYSTYLGGSGGGVGFPEEGADIKVDGLGNAYVVGSASSTNFPLTAPVQAFLGGGGVDAFVAKLNPDGNAFLYSTFLGGKGVDYGTAIALDGTGKPVVTGHTSSPNFPTLNPLQATNAGLTDAYVTKLDALGSALLFSSYLGGSLSDGGTAVGVGPTGLILLAGTTQSSNFPTRYPIQGWLGGSLDSFVARISDYAPSTPQAISVSPSSGAGSIQAFDLLYSDQNGFDDLRWAYVLFQTQVNQAAACYAQYRQSDNTLWLRNDAGNAWLGPVTIGQPGVLDNSQCTLDAQSSFASLSGFNVILRLMLSFKPSFAGTKNVYMYGADVSGLNSGWQLRGTWATQIPAPPQAISVAPSSGTGTSQSFTFTFSDDNGSDQLSWLYALVNTQIVASNSCYIQYKQSDNTLWLRNNAGNAWIGPVAVGSASTIENSQCSISSGGASVARSGAILTLVTPITFKAAFAGPKNVYMYGIDSTSLNSGWQQRGAWTPQAPYPPAAVSALVPSSAGPPQIFGFTFSDPNGYQELTWTYGLIHSALNQAGACYVQYKLTDNTLWLRNDAGNAWLGPIALGSAATLTNSQCTLDAQPSSVFGDGTTLTVNVSLSFKQAFNGSKKVYMYAIDSSGLNSGWQQRGTTIIAVP